MTPSQSITAGQLSDWALEVAPFIDGANDDPAYVPVRGIQELSPPAIDKNQEDDGDFDGGPWSSSTSTGLGWKVDGKCKVPRGGSTPDPGQQILRAAGRGVAEEGFVNVRIYNRKSGLGDTGVADVTFTDNGGPKTDLTKADFSLTGRGPLSPYTASAQEDAVASAKVTGGVVTALTVGKGGSGYLTPPVVVITGDGGVGTGAVATATVEGGQVVDLNITNGGTGYTKAKVSFTRV